ncbi:MAG: flagellar brake protein [Methyloversatilis sp.]|jgi:c-di-GMP-binding flagellar brake protein YcgR|nr:flagellar brake protein [Methyloversatilis sp.]
MSMIPVRKTDVVIGRPLPYSLYDRNNKLLLKAGVIVQSQNQLQILSERGLYRDKAAVNLPPLTARAAKHSDTKPEPERNDIELDFEAVKLKVGDVLQLQGVGDDAQRHTVRFLGYNKGGSVMVSAPVLNGGYAIVKQDSAFVVRFFSGKSVYAFPTHVLKSANTPYPYLHLSYPRVVKGMRVRRGQRASVRIIASVVDATGSSHAGTLLDISKGGALLAARNPLGAKEEELSLKFRLKFDDLDQFLQVRGVIRSVQTNPDAENEALAIQHGLEFTEVPEDGRLALTAFVYHKLIELSESN